jgi:hypothetical protein
MGISRKIKLRMKAMTGGKGKTQTNASAEASEYS